MKIFSCRIGGRDRRGVLILAALMTPLGVSAAAFAVPIATPISVGVFGGAVGTTGHVERSVTADDQIFWFEVAYPDISKRLTIDTILSGTSPSVSLDTELGLYTSAGVRVAENDDLRDAPTHLNTMSWLGNSALTFGPGGAAAGGLDAGTYYFAVSTFNTTFGSTNFDVQSSSVQRGRMVVNVHDSVPTIPTVTTAGPRNISPMKIVSGAYNTAPFPDPKATTIAYDSRFQSVEWVSFQYNSGSLLIDTGGSFINSTLANDTSFILYDSQGNPVSIAGSVGGVIEDPKYTSHGEVAQAQAYFPAGTLTPGLYYLAVGAQLESLADPIFGAVSDAQSVAGTLSIRLLSELAADLNRDGVVDSLDIGEILNRFGNRGTNLYGDLTGNGVVDSLDIGEVLNKFGNRVNGITMGLGNMGASPVPEPSSLVGLGVAGLLLMGRRRR